MQLPVMPPVSPMLAKPVPQIPEGPLDFEPKWDGFRSIIFRDGDEVEIGSRNEKPMTRYFPEVVEAVRAQLPRAVRGRRRDRRRRRIGDRLDFEALQQRIHPAASRVKLLAGETPAQLRRVRPAGPGRRGPDRAAVRASAGRALEEALADAQAADPPHAARPATTAVAQEWFEQFEGAGLDGVIAKPLDGTYQPDKRVDVQDQARAHRRLRRRRLPRAQDAAPDAIGSLLLGLYDDDGRARVSVGVIGAFPMARRKELFEELQPLVTDVRRPPVGLGRGRRRATARRATPRAAAGTPARTCRSCRCGPSGWSRSRYDHMEGVRFRHTAQFVRWRPDRDPRVLHLRPARGARQLRPRRRPQRLSRRWPVRRLHGEIGSTVTSRRRAVASVLPRGRFVSQPCAG